MSTEEKTEQLTHGDEIALRTHQLDEIEAEVERECPTLRKASVEEERARTKRRNALGQHLEDDQRTIALLLEHLSAPDLPQDEQAVIVRMLQRTYISMLDRALEFKQLDGSLYSVNYGLLRHIFERE